YVRASAMSAPVPWGTPHALLQSSEHKSVPQTHRYNLSSKGTLLVLQCGGSGHEYRRKDCLGQRWDRIGVGLSLIICWAIAVLSRRRVRVVADASVRLVCPFIVRLQFTNAPPAPF